MDVAKTAIHSLRIIHILGLNRKFPTSLLHDIANIGTIEEYTNTIQKINDLSHMR